MKTCEKKIVYIGLSLNNDNVKYCQLVPHLPGLRGRGETWVNSIKLANRHHARVYLVVQLQSEYRDQHDVHVNVASPEKTGNFTTTPKTDMSIVIYFTERQRVCSLR